MVHKNTTYVRMYVHVLQGSKLKAAVLCKQDVNVVESGTQAKMFLKISRHFGDCATISIHQWDLYTQSSGNSLMTATSVCDFVNQLTSANQTHTIYYLRSYLDHYKQTSKWCVHAYI